jgi:hypothetical protein
MIKRTYILLAESPPQKGSLVTTESYRLFTHTSWFKKDALNIFAAMMENLSKDLNTNIRSISVRYFGRVD